MSATAGSPFKSSVHVLDKVANMEAMLVAFIAEHSLPFSLSESLIDLANELSKDEAALDDSFIQTNIWIGPNLVE